MEAIIGFIFGNRQRYSRLARREYMKLDKKKNRRRKLTKNGPFIITKIAEIRKNEDNCLDLTERKSTYLLGWTLVIINP